MSQEPISGDEPRRDEASTEDVPRDASEGASPAGKAAAGKPAADKPAGRKGRTGPRQFTREVRGELKRVQWPTRREVTSYSVVVLVAVAIITVYIFAIDQAFGAFMLQIFG
jgi:preprotein translocase subunit SecE